MTDEQYYRLEDAWPKNEWPMELSNETVELLNEVAPKGYHYTLSPSSDTDAPVVELYEYVGEGE